MAGLLDGVMEQLGSTGTDQIANSLGVDADAMGGLLSAALPAIVGGMANNAQKPDGAASLAAALDQHDDSVFGNLGSLVGGGGDGDKILGHVLGQRRGAVEQQLAGTTGMDVSVVTKLLPMLAPLVMGYLSSQKKAENLDEKNLGAVLGAERKAVEAKQPGLGGLASILDADNDGDIMDDVMDLATGGSGAAAGGKSKGGLGGLLGKILGR